MTEDQIERRIARETDALDERFLTTAMTQAEYDRESKAIDARGEALYRAAALQTEAAR